MYAGEKPMTALLSTVPLTEDVQAYLQRMCQGCPLGRVGGQGHPSRPASKETVER
jgi:hypothetical protein